MTLGPEHGRDCDRRIRNAATCECSTFKDMLEDVQRDPMIGTLVLRIGDRGHPKTVYFFERWTADDTLVREKYAHRMGQILPARTDIQATTDTRVKSEKKKED